MGRAGWHINRMLVAKIRRLGRMATAGMRLRPGFMIVGAQKAGTTSLYHYLTRHPRVLSAEYKELHYFDIRYHRSPIWYRSNFPLWRRSAITGEATPYYIFHPDALARIARHFPDIRILVLLRNPVERAISHYFHAKRMGVESLPLEEALAKEAERLAEAEIVSDCVNIMSGSSHQHHSYLARGIYQEQLERCFALFDEEQLWIRSSEEFFADPESVVRDALAFLGIDAAGFRLDAEPKLVGRYDDTVPESVVDWLSEYYRPHNRRLFEYLGRDYGW